MGKLHKLVSILESCGYFRNYATFGDGNLRTWDWKFLAPKLEEPLASLWKFFLCGEDMERARGEELLGRDALDRLVELELCGENDGRLSMGEVVLITYQRQPVFLDMAGPSRARIGDDVHTLVNQVGSGRKRRILSLYSSGGSESFLFLENNGSDVSVRPSFESENFARANWELSGAEGTMTLLGPDETIEGGPFDLILARIPSLVTPEGYDLPEIESGGRDGLDGYRSVFESVGASLADDGEFYFVGLLFGIETSILESAKKLEELAENSGLILDLQILARQRMEPGTNLFNQAIYVAEKKSNKEVRQLMDDFMGHFESNSWNFAHYVKGTARRRSEPQEAHRVLNVSDKYFGTWAI